MIFTEQLIRAKFIRRYKRFLADVILNDGTEMTVHCANTGSMRNCLVEGSPCWISDSRNPKRKYRYTLEQVTTSTGHLAGVNTGLANALVSEALGRGLIPAFRAYTTQLREKKYGAENSRIDFLLQGEGVRDCYLEVKSVTLGEENGNGLFPDAVSERASKHLRELLALVKNGLRGSLVFCVQHNGIESVSPADNIDPAYGENLRQAVQEGVDVTAWLATLDDKGSELVREIPVLL